MFLDIRMISEGSCDTEDWSNDAENTALHHGNNWHFKIYYTKKVKLLTKYIYCIFDQINAASVSLGDFSLKMQLLYWSQTFEGIHTSSETLW